MAWVAIEDFNGLSDATNLAGQSGSGASGWSAAWVNSATNLIRSTTDQAFDGSSASAEVVSGGGNTFYTRTLTTSISGSGVVYIAMRRTANNSGENAFSLRSSGGNRCGVVMNSAGNLTVGGETLVAYSTNTWYVIRITFDVGAGTYTGAYSTGGAYSAETSSRTMGSSGNIDRVGIGGDTGTGIDYVGLISDTDPFGASGPANLKTLNGIAKANIKTINGIAIASLKSFNGVV